MTAPQHVYQIQIKADPDRIWQAITDPDFTTDTSTRSQPPTSKQDRVSACEN